MIPELYRGIPTTNKGHIGRGEKIKDYQKGAEKRRETGGGDIEGNNRKGEGGINVDKTVMREKRWK